MMSDLGELYQEILLEHNSRPKNFRQLEDATATADGFNPLCGDKITLYIKVEDDTVADVGFQGTGCAISRASASMLTQSIKGQTVARAQEIFQAFHTMLTEPGAEPDYDTLGDLETLSGVIEFPTRIKCAVLAWHTMISALNGSGDPVTTE
ncbi:MAG: SUF system NifU family Fe-S cluster assembly protein [SAR202 cluster bacterium Io17-Chloro-G9]|nr:MAG: SUF system NifU family Fe-S cluster assembly protein [SAR202 cluster bacterium Io17-Chloro-G9]